MSINNIIDSFYHVFVKIKDLYGKIKTDNSHEIWTLISTLLHENSSIVTQIYKKARTESNIREIVLNYTDKEEKLLKQIETEENVIFKLSLMVTVLHQILYNLMSTKDHYMMILDGQKEMIVLKKDIKYYVHVSDKLEKNIFFHAYILVIALESLFDTSFYLGADFEYTGIDPVYKRKKIQLAQLNFEHNTDSRSMIMIVSPSELEPTVMKNFIRLVMCNHRIKKILHGSDALDIPYLYEQMLENNPTKITKFTRGLIDTRFLCEYYKINKGEPDHKCSIYDALLYFKTVSPEKFEELNRIVDEEMPYKHDVTWNIYRLSTAHVKYALYDVIFLKYFYYSIIRMATEESSDMLEQKVIIELYKKVLFELTQFVYLDNNKIVFVKAKCKEEIDPINNYMVRHPRKILKLIDIYNQISKKLITVDPKVEIDKIFNVNHFKRMIEIIIKKIVYTLATRKFTIYKDKTTVWSSKLDNSYLFEFFDEMNYLYLGQMFRELEKILDTRLKILFT